MADASVGNILDKTAFGAVDTFGGLMDDSLAEAIKIAGSAGSTDSGPMLVATLTLQKDTNAFQQVSELTKKANEVSQTVARQMG